MTATSTASKTKATDGWIVFNDTLTSGNITKLTGELTVPPAPSEPEQLPGQLIYLFIGIEPGPDAPYGAIIQPVLQWTNADGWQMINYYVKNGKQSQASATYDVSEGDTIGMSIIGTTSTLPDGKTQYSYVCSFSVNGVAETDYDITINTEVPFIGGFVTLETYSITGCAGYPNTEKTTFSKINLEVDGVVPTRPKHDGCVWNLTPSKPSVSNSMCSNIEMGVVAYKAIDAEFDIYYQATS